MLDANCSPQPNSIVTKSEPLARLPAAHARHEKRPAASDSLPHPNMKDIFWACLSEAGQRRAMIQGMLLCPGDTQIGPDLQMLGGFLRLA